MLYIPLILSGAFFKKAKLKTNNLGLPIAKDFGRMILTFVLVVIGLILFRADSVGQAGEYVWKICDKSLFAMPSYYSITWLPPMLLWLPMMIIVEWRNRNRGHGLDIAHIAYKWQLTIYVVLTIVVFAFGATSEKFIYFQF